MADDFDFSMMDRALDEGRKALASSCLPVGAVLAMGDRVLAAGQKTMGSNHLDHAEMIVFRAVFQGDYPYTRQDDICLYTTLEPCIMCWGALRHLPISRLVFAMDDPYGGASRIPEAGLPPRHRSRAVMVRGGVRKDEARSLFRQFLDQTREPFWLNGGAAEFVRAVRSES